MRQCPALSKGALLALWMEETLLVRIIFFLIVTLPPIAVRLPHYGSQPFFPAAKFAA